jgi:hypothetical protein
MIAARSLRLRAALVLVLGWLFLAAGGASFAQGTSDEEEGDNPGERLEYLRNLRGDTPEGDPPAGGIQAFLMGFNQVQSFLSQKSAKAVHGDGWQSVGPTSVPNGQRGDLSLGISVSGRVTSVVVHPTNPLIIYIGTASGGVWRSTNGGANWSILTRDEPTQSIGDITLDPQQPNTVWVGTGESINTGQSSSFFGLGLLRSTNGGNTWQHFPGPFAAGSTLSRIRRIAVDRTNSNTVLFADKSGLYRVTNALSDTPAFTNLDPGGVWWDILQDAANPGTWFGTRSAAGGGSDFVRVTNIGGVPQLNVLQTWAGNWTIGATNGSFSGRSQITQCAATPNTIYAIVQAPPGHRVFRSTTSGAAWQDADPTLASSMRAGSIKSQAFYDLYITVDPANANNVIVGDVLLFRSTNATNANPAWADLTESGPTDANIHWDNHDGAFSGAAFFACCDGGIFATSNILASPVVWASLNNGITTIQVNQNAFSLSPAAGNERMMIGTQDNGTLRRDNAGGTTTWRTLGSGDGGFCFYSPNSAAGNNAYQSYIAGSMSYSTNMNAGAPGFGTNQLLTGQAPFSPNTSGSDGNYFAFYPVAAISPAANPDRVVVAGGQSNATNALSGRLWYHNNAASAPGGWVDISANVPNRPADEFDAIAFSVTNPNVFYAAEGNQVFRTNDVTVNPPAWQQVGAGTLPNKGLTDIAVDPNNDGHLVVVYSGYDGNLVFETQNANAGAAAVWANRSSNLPRVPLFSAVIDNNDSAEWYVGGDLGVWRTRNRGSSWDLVGNGMPLAATVFDLKIDPNRNELLAATFGSGVFLTTLCDAQVTISEASPVVTCTGPGTLSSLTVHGTAGSRNGNVTKVEYRIDPPDPVVGFGPWQEAEAAPLPNKFADWVAPLQVPVGRSLFQVRVTTDSGASCNTAIRDLVIETLDVSPSVTVESPSLVSVCDDIEDVELHGFAASCGSDPIARVEYSSGGGPFITNGVWLATANTSFTNYVIHLGAPGGGNLPASGQRTIRVRTVTLDEVISTERTITIEILENSPSLTIESEQVVTVCDDVEDVELHGFAASCGDDPIQRVEFRNVTANPAGPFITAGVTLATANQAFVSYVINLGPPGPGGNLPFIFPATNGRNRIEVRAATVDGIFSDVRFVEIEVLDVVPAITVETANPLNVCITDPDVEIHGFVQSCPADPINVVEFSVNGGAFAPVDEVATIREGFDSWVLHLGAPDGARLPINNTEIRVRARTVDNDTSVEVSTFVRWPRIAIQNVNLALAGDVGSGLGVQPAVLGDFTVAETDGFVQTRTIHLALQGILLPADGSTPTLSPENILIIPDEFELQPGQSQFIQVQVTIPLNTSFGVPMDVTPPPIPSLLHGPVPIRARGECTNPVQTDLQVTVTPFRDEDLIRRGFPYVCGDCAPSHWQMFSFPVIGLDHPFNPALFGSTLRNQLEDDFGLINFGPAPFNAVRWDPARRENISFARHNPMAGFELLEPTTIIHPGEAFSMVRRARGDITMDGFFLNHATNQAVGNYPHVRFPSLGTAFEGSFDQSRPLLAPLSFPTAIQVGNPYMFPIRIYEQGVEDLVTALPLSPLTAIPVPDVVRSVRLFNRWVGEEFLAIQGDPDIPAEFSPWNGLLRPTEGCFLQYGTNASADTAIVFNKPPVVSDYTPWPQVIDFTNKSLDKEKELADSQSPQKAGGDSLGGWGFRITASNGEGLSRTIVVGVYPGATSGVDTSDVESIFPAGARPVDLEAFDFTISRPGEGKTGIFLRDLRAPGDALAGYALDLDVVSQDKDQVVLTCEPIGDVPQRIAAVLKDDAGEEIADLSSSGASLDVPGGATSYTLEIKAWAKADVNQDNSINGLDLFGFSKEYEKDESHNPADLNGNGEVEPADLLDLLKDMKK